jgi:hypothetical protein
MATKRFFFVTGLPRSRTAWLSVFLTGYDSFCFHEGTGRFPDWASYVKALRERPEPWAGDSNPALIEHIDDLLAEFPDARFLIVRRDPGEALASFCASAPQEAEVIRAGWSDYVQRFEQAVAKIPDPMVVTMEGLKQEIVCRQLMVHLLRLPMDSERWRQLSDLRITTTFPEVRSKPKACTVDVNVEGFDFSGLSVRQYVQEDRPMLDEWWAYHKEAKMHAIRLPPLGIIVEDDAGPVAALWCYETFGTGVAWLAVPVTRPQLDYARASTVLAFAIMAMTQLAGTGHEPKGQFTCFRVIGPKSMGRLLERLGFTHQPDRTNYFLSL